MAKSLADLRAEIDAMKAKLEETQEGMSYNRGPTNDAIKIVVPMLMDQLQLLREILEFTDRPTDRIG